MYLISPLSLSHRLSFMPLELLQALETLSDAAKDEPVGSARFPAAIVEHDDRYVVELEVPGVTPDEVKVEVRESRVSIEVNRKPVERTGRTVYSDRRINRSERFVFAFRALAAEGHEARLADGVLTLTLLKQPKEQPKAQTIPVK